MEQTQEKHSDSHVLESPAWLLGIRFAQILLSLICFGLGAGVVHDAYLDELGLNVAMGVLTWVILAYILLSERVATLNHLYHIIAVISLDGFLMVMWLATFAATAARRSGFIYNVSVNSCYNNGQSVNSNHCSYSKRGVVLFKKGQDMMSAAAGLGALVWLLFIATFVWTILQFVNGRKQGRFPIGTTTGEKPANASGQAEQGLQQQQAVPLAQNVYQPTQPQAPVQNAMSSQYPETAYPMHTQQPVQYQQQPPHQQPQPHQQSPPPPAQAQYPPTQSPYHEQPSYSPPPQGGYTPSPDAYAQQYQQHYQQPAQSQAPEHVPTPQQHQQQQPQQQQQQYHQG